MRNVVGRNKFDSKTTITYTTPPSYKEDNFRLKDDNFTFSWESCCKALPRNVYAQMMAEQQGLVDHFNFYVDFFQRIANSLYLGLRSLWHPRELGSGVYSNNNNHQQQQQQLSTAAGWAWGRWCTALPPGGGGTCRRHCWRQGEQNRYGKSQK